MSDNDPPPNAAFSSDKVQANVNSADSSTSSHNDYRGNEGPEASLEVPASSQSAVEERAVAPSAGQARRRGTDDEEEDAVADALDTNIEEDVVDVKESLSNAFLQDFDNISSFFCFRSYSDAPNPILRLTDLDIVGLPLSSRDAEAIRQSGINTTGVTPKDPSVWSFSPQSVRCEDPSWELFLKRIARDVCQNMEIEYSPDMHHLHLYAFQLYEPQCRISVPETKVMSADGTFASIMVVLPSICSSGTMQFSLGGLSFSYTCGPSNLFHTTVISWLSGAAFSLGPVTDGYQLALVYNLVHTDAVVPRPLPSTNPSAVESIRRTLQFWSQDGGRGTRNKVLYLLEEAYPAESLSLAALHGSDYQKARVMNALAQELGFYLGLANVDCHLCGFAHDKYRALDKERRKKGKKPLTSKNKQKQLASSSRQSQPIELSSTEAEADSDEEEQDVIFGDIDIREAEVDRFVDIRGEWIADALEFDTPEEVIPEDLCEDAEGEDHYKQEYDGYRNSNGALDRWYRRTVLVIWPRRCDLAVRYGSHNLEGACQIIAAIAPRAEPTVDELALVKHVIQRAVTKPHLVANAICHVASCWKQPELLAEAIEECCKGPVGVSLLTFEQITSAITLFSFKAMMSSLERMLASEAGNEPRIKFLERLAAWASDHPSSATEVIPWVATNIENASKSLRRPQADEQPFLVSLAISRGGLHVLTDSILPQIKDLVDAEFLKSLANTVFESQSVDGGTKEQVASVIMRNAISKLDLHVVPKPPIPPTEPKKPDTILASAQAYLKFCLMMCPGTEDLLLDRLCDVHGLDAADVAAHTVGILLPFLAILVSETSTLAKSFAELRARILKFVARVSSMYLDCVIATPAQFGSEHIRAVLSAVTTLQDGATVIADTILPRLHELTLAASAYKQLVLELQSSATEVVLPTSYTGPDIKTIISSLVVKFALSVPLDTYTIAKDALVFCFRHHAAAARTAVLQRLLDPTTLTPAYTSSVLMPLVPDLCQLGREYGVEPGISSALQTIMIAWVDKVLGPKAPLDNTSLSTQMASWVKVCKCYECTKTRNFLAQADATSLLLDHLGPSKKNHMQGLLRLFASSVVSWSFSMATDSSVGLRLSKLDSYIQALKWEENQRTGSQHLKLLALDDAGIKVILGSHYERITMALKPASTTIASSIPPATPKSKPTASASLSTPSTSQPRIRPTPNNRVVSAGVSRKATSSLSSAPPKKKRKKTFDPADVIDLTSD